MAEPPPSIFTGGAEPSRRLPQWVHTWLWPLGLTLGAYVFASVLTSVAAARLAALPSIESFTVGAFQQGLWWTAHGVTMGATYATNDASLHRMLGLHFSPLLTALSPLYRMRPEASTLLWIQALALGLAALPLYAAARLKIGKMGAGLVAIAWWFHPTITGSPLDGFHEFAFAPLFAFAAFWALLKRRWFPYMLGLVALLLIREDLAFFVILVGFVASAQKAESRFVTAPIVAGAAWFAASVLWILPHYRTPALAAADGSFLGQYFAGWGASLGSMAAQAMAQPVDFVKRLFSREALLYLASVLRPTGFLLPLPDPAWIAGLEKLVVNLGAEGARLRNPLAGSSIPVVMAFFMAIPGALGAWGRRLGLSHDPEAQLTGGLEERGAAVRAAARIGDPWKARELTAADAGRAGAPAAAIVVIAGVLALLMSQADRRFTPTPRADLADQLAVLSAVPDSVPVLAPDYAFARLANRSRFACIGSLGNRALEPEVLARFDAVVLDMAPESPDMKDHPEIVKELETTLRTDRDFHETLSAGRIHLFERLKGF